MCSLVVLSTDREMRVASVFGGIYRFCVCCFRKKFHLFRTLDFGKNSEGYSGLYNPSKENQLGNLRSRKYVVQNIAGLILMKELTFLNMKETLIRSDAYILT